VSPPPAHTYGVTHAVQAIGLALQAIALANLTAPAGRRLVARNAALAGVVAWFGLIVYDGAVNPATARHAPQLVHTAVGRRSGSPRARRCRRSVAGCGCHWAAGPHGRPPRRLDRRLRRHPFSACTPRPAARPATGTGPTCNRRAPLTTRHRLLAPTGVGEAGQEPGAVVQLDHFSLLSRLGPPPGSGNRSATGPFITCPGLPPAATSCGRSRGPLSTASNSATRANGATSVANWSGSTPPPGCQASRFRPARLHPGTRPARCSTINAGPRGSGPIPGPRSGLGTAGRRLRACCGRVVSEHQPAELRQRTARQDRKRQVGRVELYRHDEVAVCREVARPVGAGPPLFGAEHGTSDNTNPRLDATSARTPR
jgi:hypothetical protein